jgi:hypothetical protein
MNDLHEKRPGTDHDKKRFSVPGSHSSMGLAEILHLDLKFYGRLLIV